jgi:ferredoxin
MAAPEVFRLREEDGHSFVHVTEFTPELMEAARRAALTCPEQAIVIEE